jgi:gamma-glutamyltranspeptidase/glutathione hydrolase
LLALNIAEGWNLGEMPFDSPERLHLMVEAMRFAFADARQYITDPTFQAVPIRELLGKGYAAQRRGLVSPETAQRPHDFGMPLKTSDTVYLSVVDGEGNACSFINSLYTGFGSGIVANGTGIFLQSRGANFSLDPDHPNVLAGGKRPYHTIIPGMALQDGQLWASFGVMGGFMQPQGHFQVISAMVDDNLNPQEALDRPRFCLVGGTSEAALALEEGIPVSAITQLADMGHQVNLVMGFNRRLFGCGQIIRRDADTGVLYGGSDPRKDGLVAAF